MHLRRLPSGRWQATVKHHGQRRTATAATRGEAQRAGAELLLELGGGGKRGEHNVSVADMLSAHLAAMAPVDDDNGWSPGYHHDALQVVAKLEKEARTFRNRRIRDVTPAVLTGLYRELSRGGWSRWRIKRLHTVMSTAWQMAITYEWATSNPCRLVAPPTPHRPDIKPPSQEQVTAILTELDGVEQLAIRLNATLGIRRGDLCGLQWGDVDWERGEILIARSLAYVPAAPVQGGNAVAPSIATSPRTSSSNDSALVLPGNLHVRPTKSGKRSHRRLPLDLPTISLLRKVHARQAQMALEHGLPAPLWVISDDAGASPWRPDRVSRLFRRVADRVGATNVHLHSLRHFVATQMLEDGDSPHDVAGQLGNTPAVVESTYRHWLPGRNRDSVDRRAARLGGSG